MFVAKSNCGVTRECDSLQKLQMSNTQASVFTRNVREPTTTENTGMKIKCSCGNEKCEQKKKVLLCFECMWVFKKSQSPSPVARLMSHLNLSQVWRCCSTIFSLIVPKLAADWCCRVRTPQESSHRF